MKDARRVGRPRINENGGSREVGLSIPTKQYDEYCALALRHGLSVPEVIRRVLAARRREAGETE